MLTDSLYFLCEEFVLQVMDFGRSTIKNNYMLVIKYIRI
ncbi:hypothetical protein Misp06_00957 [Microbulbifer sp. NBRC 101763]